MARSSKGVEVAIACSLADFRAFCVRASSVLKLIERYSNLEELV